MKQPTITEAQLHAAVADFLEVALPAEYPWTTIGHGGGGMIRGAFLKRMGVKKGWPDIIIVQPPLGRIIGIELKRPKGGKISEAQLGIELAITSAGGSIHFCRSLDDVIMCLNRIEGIRLRVTNQKGSLL